MANLKDIYKKYAEDYLIDPMTIWIGSEGTEKARAFLFGNHLGIDRVRDMVADIDPDFKVYAVRGSDYDWDEPATIEPKEVMVNFVGYLITNADLDWMFKGKDWQEVYDWTYDWDGEEYWK